MINFAAMQNFDPEWFAIFEKMGLQIVLLRVDAKVGSPIYHVSKLEEIIDGLLKERGAGHLDSTGYPGGSHLHFYHVPKDKLGEAVASIKLVLENYNLLGVSEIYHAEAYDRFCQWWPPTAEVTVMES